MSGQAAGFRSGEVAFAAVAWGADAGAAGEGRRGLVGDFDDFNIGVASLLRVRDAHVVELVAVGDVLVVEPGAVAGLPWGGADHAELCCAAAGMLLDIVVCE